MGVTDPDVVAELRHWLNQGVTPPLQVTERARNEIVALRKENDAFHARCSELIAEKIRLRFAALEEAARVCDEFWKDEFSSELAAAIRALKDQPQP